MIKEKGKSHPFAGHLRPDEDILWMSQQFQPQPSDGRYVLYIVVFVLLMLVVGSAIMNSIALIAVAGAILGISAVPVVLLWAAVRIFKKPPKPESVYAVTSERLLYRTPEAVIDLPLERVGTIAVHNLAGHRGDLNFGRLFVKWDNINDPEAVKLIIQQARTKHLQTIATDS